MQGLVLNYCRCTDLFAGEGKYFTGPRCQYEATVANHFAPAELTLPQTEREATINQAQIGAQQEENVTTSAGGGLSAKRKFANDGSCGDQACNSHGICSKKVCYCDLYHTGEACERDLAHPGVQAPLSALFCAVALTLGLITGGFVAKVYNDNRKQLFL